MALAAQLLAQDLSLLGITGTIKRAWVGRTWTARNERSYEGFDRLNEGGQEQHGENHHLRPQRDVRKH